MIDAGESAELECHVVNTNHESINLRLIRSYKWVNEEGQLGKNENKLVINPFEPDKAGSYRCTVTFKRSFNHWVPLQERSTPYYQLHCKGEDIIIVKACIL